MSIWSLLIEAIESLSANKMRSGLTMLGIIIGVAAVIAMLGIGTGTEASITSEIESIGTNLLYITTGGDATNPEALTLADVNAIQNEALAPSVAYAAPILHGQGEIAIAGESTNTSVIGVTPDFFQVQIADLSEGILINQDHLDNFDSVALLGAGTAEDLFGYSSDLTGKTIRVNGEIFKVIGVLQKQGGSNFTNPDDRVLIPLSTAQSRLFKRPTPNQVDLIYVQARSADAVTKAESEVSQILRSRHRSTLGEDDFDIMSTQSFLDMASSITGTLTIFLGGIAGISLLVGGIGIMNIMLVTVVERTKEIGLRKAMGARRTDILIQFLVESSFLSLGGGVIGIALGYAISFLIGQIAAGSSILLNPVIELNSILMATLFSAAVGLFFGIFPANRAASLEPVEALRTE
jgi:putative ABC transport system permease protein